MIPHVGTSELIIIFLVALLVFGPKKLPEIGKSIGQGLRELKKASREVMDTIQSDDEAERPKTSVPADSKETSENAADSNNRTN
jgi:sec-independent protein translocase protein TatA